MLEFVLSRTSIKAIDLSSIERKALYQAGIVVILAETQFVLFLPK
jgi:hypothetical protein